MNFSNIEELYSYLERSAIPAVLETKVAEVCVQTGEKHTQTDVYDAYTSTSQRPYERTFELMKDWKAELISPNTLELTNTRSENGRDIPLIIESGKNYWTPALDALIGARPFFENTREELAGGVAADAMRDGLAVKLGAGVVTVT
jgi:hypothetical protein